VHIQIARVPSHAQKRYKQFQASGNLCRFELIPLEEMDGRPRVDVLCNMSGIFRDSFQNVVELLEDLFQRAADADEPEDRNFIRCAAGSLLSTSGIPRCAFVPLQARLRVWL
jgi:cobalamin biosynthesis Mg chelatase CobN